MLRYLVPVLLFAGAGFVWYYNDTHTGSILLMPGLDLIPSLQGDPHAQGQWSWRIVAALGVVLLVLNVATRPKPRPDDEDDAAAGQ